MDNDQQIAAIKSGLAAVDAAIAQTESALRAASNFDDIRSLTSALVDLRSERARLQAQLDNLEAAQVEVLAPDAAPPAKMTRVMAAKQKKMMALHQELADTLADRTVVDATLKLAAGVHDRAKTLRELIAEPTKK
jgi:hypothetical protein